MPTPPPSKNYICVDVEAAGPTPPDYSLLSIGACTIFGPLSTFYIELQPVNNQFTPVAIQVNNFFFDKLTAVPTIKDYMDGIQAAG